MPLRQLLIEPAGSSDRVVRTGTEFHSLCDALARELLDESMNVNSRHERIDRVG